MATIGVYLELRFLLSAKGSQLMGDATGSDICCTQLINVTVSDSINVAGHGLSTGLRPRFARIYTVYFQI